MSKKLYEQAEIDTYLPGLGLEKKHFPSPLEISRIKRNQTFAPAGMSPLGESVIIDLGWLGGLFVYWEMGFRGLTIGLRLKLLGTTHDLGSATIDQKNPVVTIDGPDIGGYVATLSAGVNTAKCELFVDVRLKCPWPINDTLGGKLAIIYARPLPQVRRGKIQADGITPEMAEAIRNTPERIFKTPPPGFIQRDEVTSTILRTVLWLINGYDYIAEARLTAEAISAADPAFDPNKLLIAFGIAGNYGVGVGVDGAAGFYITGGGEVGWFGSIGMSIGLLVGISGGVAIYVFWTGTRGFSGASLSVTLAVGRSLGPKFPFGIGASVSLFWSVNPRGNFMPQGFCVGVSIGIGNPLPVAGYITFGQTYIGKLGQVWGKQALLPP